MLRNYCKTAMMKRESLTLKVVYKLQLTHNLFCEQTETDIEASQ